MRKRNINRIVHLRNEFKTRDLRFAAEEVIKKDARRRDEGNADGGEMRIVERREGGCAGGARRREAGVEKSEKDAGEDRG